MDELIKLIGNLNEVKAVFKGCDYKSPAFHRQADMLTLEEKENIREAVTGLLMLSEQAIREHYGSDRNLLEAVNKAKKEIRTADIYAVVYLRTLLIMFATTSYTHELNISGIELTDF